MSASPERMPKCGPIGGSAPVMIRCGYVAALTMMREIYYLSVPHDNDDIFLPCDFAPTCGDTANRDGPQRNVVYEHLQRVLAQNNAALLEGFCAVITGYIATPASGCAIDLDCYEEIVRHTSHLEVGTAEQIANSKYVLPEGPCIVYDS